MANKVNKVSQAEMDLRTKNNELMVKLQTLEAQAKNLEADYHRVQGAIELLKTLIQENKGAKDATTNEKKSDQNK